MSKSNLFTNFFEQMAIDKDKALILNRIKSHYKFKKEAELGKLLGVASNTLANWRKRNSVDLELILTKCEELNANWICSGIGRPTNDYPLPEDDSYSKVEESFEKLSSAKDIELERLQTLLAAKEQAIAAQAKTIATLELLIATLKK